MKKLIILSSMLAATMFATAQSTSWSVDNSHSNVKFTVTHLVVSEVDGSFRTYNGSIESTKADFDGAAINFTVDVNSVNTDNEMRDKHLKADDFFGVEKHPTAKLDFKLISDNGDGTYNVTADLTIKGITKPITFVIAVKGNTAVAKLNVDRTKYDIKYKSKNFFENLGDNVINDEFELTVNLQF